MRMRPREDVALLRMIQPVETALAATTAFCPLLEEGRRTSQAWAWSLTGLLCST